MKKKYSISLSKTQAKPHYTTLMEQHNTASDGSMSTLVSTRNAQMERTDGTNSFNQF